MIAFTITLIIYNLVCLLIVRHLILNHVSFKRAEIFKAEQLDKLEEVTSVNTDIWRTFWHVIRGEAGFIVFLLYIAAFPAVLINHYVVRYRLIALNKRFQKDKEILAISDNFVYYVYNGQLFIKHNDERMLHTHILPSEVVKIFGVNLTLSYKELYELLKGTSYSTHSLALWRKYHGLGGKISFFGVQSDVIRRNNVSGASGFLYSIWRERVIREIITK